MQVEGHHLRTRFLFGFERYPKKRTENQKEKIKAKVIPKISFMACTILSKARASKV